MTEKISHHQSPEFGGKAQDYYILIVVVVTQIHVLAKNHKICEKE